MTKRTTSIKIQSIHTKGILDYFSENGLLNLLKNYIKERKEWEKNPVSRTQAITAVALLYSLGDDMSDKTWDFLRIHFRNLANEEHYTGKILSKKTLTTTN